MFFITSSPGEKSGEVGTKIMKYGIHSNDEKRN